MDTEKLFIRSENKALTDSSGLKLAAVSPLDQHFRHLIGHSVHIFHWAMFMHILGHIKYLMSSKTKTEAVGEYLLKKYSK
jgi:hypothetical protein